MAAALRPIAVVSAPLAADAGETVTLSGNGSLGADGRTIASHAWSLVTGATSLTALAGNQTSFVTPGTGGDVVVRLTVTDDLGRTDSIDAAVRINGMAPPPPPPPSRDSGGSSGGRRLAMRSTGRMLGRAATIRTAGGCNHEPT